MVKGMSATELIVALAVGLIVIVGLGYLVWTWLGRGGGTVEEQFCRAKLLTYCAKNPSATDFTGFFASFTECQLHQVSIERDATTCEEFLGLSGRSETTTT